MCNLPELEEYAQNFPSMGGARLGPFLDTVIKKIENNTSIVEVGSWLGAGTAQLALSVLKNNKKDHINIHTFDGWTASASEVNKIKSYPDINFDIGQDTLPWVQQKLSKFNLDIKYHRGNINHAEWHERAISLYIDDAAKEPRVFNHVLRVFGPHWIPGKTVLILMDYYMWKKSWINKLIGHACQKSFIEKYPEHFEKIDEFRGSHKVSYSNEAFLYKKKFDFSALNLHRNYPHILLLKYAMNIFRRLK